jgi:chemotaxis protein CheC
MDGLAQCALEQKTDEAKSDWLPPEAKDSNQTPELAFTKDEMSIWTWLVSRGIANAISGLSQMVGNEMRVTSLDLKYLPAKCAASLLDGSEAQSVGVYLTINGDATGHLLLMHDPEIAFQIVDVQLGQPSGSTRELAELESSVLGEMGNIAGSFFLNALADTGNMVLMPSTPEVMVDKLDAIVSVPLTNISEQQDDVIVMRATFSADGKPMEGTLMILTSPDCMRTILKNSSTAYECAQVSMA